MELELTQAKTEHAQVKLAITHKSQSKMATPNPINVSMQNQGQRTTQRVAVPTLTALQFDAVVQEEFKALEESLRETQFFLVSLTNI